MLILLLLAAASPAHSSSAALKLCRPTLERKAEGQIDRITVQKSSRRRGTTTIMGRMTVFVGMGAPAPGSASTHHLIRAEYEFECSVRHGRVRRTKLTQP